jgi:lipopolysaccharide export system protein LptA
MTLTRIAPKGPAARFGLAGMALVGMAAVHFWPGDARAQAPGTGFATAYKGNADKPVNIEADSLEVDDRKKVAVFRGNVSATQGDVNMKSKEIEVSYNGASNKTASADNSAPAASAAPFGGGGEITQIDAKGDVFITMKPSKEGDKPQTAKSDWALFDVKKQQVTMGGGEVVLTQGENVLRGTKLIVDITTGLSRFENKGGRIGAIFTPPPKDKNKEANKETKKTGAEQ